MWEDNLAHLNETLKEGSFRHGVTFVPVSSLAEQYYCELKVEHEYTQGEVLTEAKTEGSLVHDQVFEMQKTSLAKLIKAIRSRPATIASFLIGAKIAEINFAGIPDAVFFESGRPRYVIELKTTTGDLGVVRQDQEVQAKTYGLLLDEMGFDCSRLEIVIVKFFRSVGSGEEAVRKRLLGIIIDALRAESVSELEKLHDNRLRVFHMKYSRDDATRNIEWAKAYWLGSRDPFPTMQPGKCRACEFNSTCPASLAQSAHSTPDLTKQRR